MRLEELVTLDLLDQTLPSGIMQLRSLLTQLGISAAANDIHSAHATLHRLLGVSGGIGAKALHSYGTKIYPRIRDGEWPLEPDWIERMTLLGDSSAQALETWLVSAPVARGRV
jgi:two-component system, CAI-1 autoinducer sensor kinase/phosphatase CqsS